MSGPRYDAVLSYHTNPATCGVAKFNQRLAERLGVPLASVWQSARYDFPLISVKPSEGDLILLRDPDSYSLLLHDRTWQLSDHACVNARTVFYADEIGCPSTLQGDPTRGRIDVLTFGMAHKLQVHHYASLKTLLDHTGDDYTVSLSTAVHEGSPWSDCDRAAERLRAVYGARLRTLGYLADDAVARELRHCTAVALFFDPAARANNTTLWAALDAGCPVITNLDEQSPAVANVYDIHRLTAWPTDLRRQRVDHPYTWERLLEKLCA